MGRRRSIILGEEKAARVAQHVLSTPRRLTGTARVLKKRKKTPAFKNPLLGDL
jgi:hypothetical protein